MLYPLKFKPVYKSYIWGGRNLEKLGKTLPEGNVAESWEVSCHPDGNCMVSNGIFEGKTLAEVINKAGREIMGSTFLASSFDRFPLLIKLIDAHDNLSIQVHPDDHHAKLNENEESGKNEAWYVLHAEEGAKVQFDIIPGTTKEVFTHALRNNEIEKYLKYVEVSPGDVIHVPAGLLHAVCKGIVLAEIQQNSNITYRVYDYNRIDQSGNLRPLHIDKALDVINFDGGFSKNKYIGLKVKMSQVFSKVFKLATRYFAIEEYNVSGEITEEANGRKFFIYIFTDGEGEIGYQQNKTLKVNRGETVLIPADLGSYSLNGTFKALKTYIPEISIDIIAPLLKAGYSEDDIYENVGGLNLERDHIA